MRLIISQHNGNTYVEPDRELADLLALLREYCQLQVEKLEGEER